MYLPVVRAVRFGHPLAVESAGRPLPELDFGPLISASQGRRAAPTSSTRRSGRGVPLYRALGDGHFLDGQDTSAYVAPASVLAHRQWSRCCTPSRSARWTPSSWWTPRPSSLAAMNACNGALVASMATDDADFGGQAREHLQAFKVGVNKPRTRGDREEVFGGVGESWKGAFVGGDLLVQAVT